MPQVRIALRFLGLSFAVLGGLGRVLEVLVQQGLVSGWRGLEVPAGTWDQLSLEV